METNEPVDKKTLYDKWSIKFKNNPFIVAILFVIAVVACVAEFHKNITELFGHSEPAPSAVNQNSGIVGTATTTGTNSPVVAGNGNTLNFDSSKDRKTEGKKK
jgi:hypothetical protein